MWSHSRNIRDVHFSHGAAQALPQAHCVSDDVRIEEASSADQAHTVHGEAEPLPRLLEILRGRHLLLAFVQEQCCHTVQLWLYYANRTSPYLGG